MNRTKKEKIEKRQRLCVCVYAKSVENTEEIPENHGNPRFKTEFYRTIDLFIE